MAVNRSEIPRHYYSLDEYLALEQSSDARFDGKWTREDIGDIDAVVTLDSMGSQLSLREIYEDVEFTVV
jgi:hypothetical protein